MGMVVRTNTMALNAYRQLGMNNNAVSKSLEKLSSGFRINRAGDDAAGLAISEKMKAQIKGLETASANAQDGISLIQTAEGNLNEVHDMLNRMVELSTKSANGTYTSTERKALQDEVDQLLTEIDRISASANFNGTKLLNGTMGLNNEAIKIGEATPYRAGGDQGISKDVVVGASNPVHEGAAVTEAKPKFSVDFQDYKLVTTEAAAGEKGTVTLDLKLNGQAIEVITDGADASTGATKAAVKIEGTAAAAVTVDGAAIAGALAGKKVNINGYVYEAKADDATGITFEFKGAWDNTKQTGIGETKVPTDASGKVLDAVVPKGNVVIGTPTFGAVKVADNTAGTAVAQATLEGRTDCPVYKITDPVAGATLARAGAKLQLTAALIQDGAKLKIGETEFTFDANTAASNSSTGTTIGIKGLSGDALLQSVTEQLSHKTTTIKKKDATGAEKTYNFKIGRQGKDTIEIEEEDTTDPTNKPLGGFTIADLKAAFKLTGKETMANTKITVDATKLADKESIVVDGKAYTFAKGNTEAETKANLVSALSSDYTVTWGTGDKANELTISASSASAKAPVIAGNGLTLQIGDTADPFNKMSVKVANMSTVGLDLDGLKTVGIMNEVSASNAIAKIKDAINIVSSTRAGMGALQNRLEHTINNLDVAAENLSAANSRIRDTDMAKEMMNYTKMNVLVQSAQAMLAQANQQPQSVLQLLQ